MALAAKRLRNVDGLGLAFRTTYANIDTEQAKAICVRALLPIGVSPLVVVTGETPVNPLDGDNLCRRRGPYWRPAHMEEVRTGLADVVKNYPDIAAHPYWTATRSVPSNGSFLSHADAVQIENNALVVKLGTDLNNGPSGAASTTGEICLFDYVD